MDPEPEEAAGTNSDVEFAPEDPPYENQDENEPSPTAPPACASAGGRSRAIDQGWELILPDNDLPVFTGRRGIKVDLAEDVDCPGKLFFRFLPEDMLRLACVQTNLYYHQHVAANVHVAAPQERPWTNVTVLELKVWLGILFNNALHNYPSMQLYWSDIPNFASDHIKSKMGQKRFEQIKRFLHLADTSTEPKSGAANYDPLYKVRPWLKALQDNSQAMYSPGKALSMDEMDISFKGRSTHKSRIKFKRAGDGFLVYALCDPSNGYTWAFYFLFDNAIPSETGLSKTFNAVFQLMKQLPSSGHHVYVDNLYSNTLLAEKLLSLGHLYTCTARKDRVPSMVMQPVLRGQAADQAKGTVKYATRRNVVALSYYDSKPVPMLTTGHHVLEEVTYTRPRVRMNPAAGRPHTVEVDLKKLNVIRDYNENMDGVDLADQLRGYYSCHLKCMKWWHAILYWILDTAACNAYLVHKEASEHPLSHLQFTTRLANDLLTEAGEKHTSSSGRKRRSSSDAASQRPDLRLIGKHQIRTIQGSAAKSPQRDCVKCKAEGKRSRSNYECGTCNVGLHANCFEEWHT